MSRRLLSLVDRHGERCIVASLFGGAAVGASVGHDAPLNNPANSFGCACVGALVTSSGTALCAATLYSACTYPAATIIPPLGVLAVHCWTKQ